MTRTTDEIKAQAPGGTDGRGVAVFMAFCIGVPWLVPGGSGPSATLLQWLFSSLATVGLCLGAPVLARIGWAAVGVVCMALCLLPRAQGASPEAVAAIAAAGMILLCASVGAGLAGRELTARTLSSGWLGAALVSGVIALCQYFGWAQHFAGWISVAPMGEAWGNLRQRNQLASLTMIGVAALVFLPARGRMAGAILAAALLAAADAATTSRIGLIQLAVVGLLAMLWRPSGPARGVALWLVALAAYTGGALLLPAVLEAWQGAPVPSMLGRVGDGTGCGSRRVLWENVLQLVGQKPLWGWGWGELDYAHYATVYPGPRFCDILDNAHNLPLHLAVELGLPVSGLAGLLVLYLIGRGAPWRETVPLRQFAWAVLLIIGLHSMVEYPLWYGPFQMATGLAAGILAGPRALQLLPQVREPALWMAKAMVATAGAAVLYVMWDYNRVSQIYVPHELRAARYRDNTLEKIQNTWLLRSQAEFAELSITPLTPANARRINALALRLLHYSPEPRVIEAVLESSLLLKRDDLVAWHLARYAAAFPDEYRAWTAGRSAAAPVVKAH